MIIGIEEIEIINGKWSREGNVNVEGMIFIDRWQL